MKVKISPAKTILRYADAAGTSSAGVRISASSGSAQKIPAADNASVKAPPTAAEVESSSRSERSSPAPKNSAISTELPIVTPSSRKTITLTIGIAVPVAASAASPICRPTTTEFATA